MYYVESVERSMVSISKALEVFYFTTFHTLYTKRSCRAVKGEEYFKLL